VGAAAVGAWPDDAPAWLGAAETKGKMRIRIIYSLHARNKPARLAEQGFDFGPVMQSINANLKNTAKASSS